MKCPRCESTQLRKNGRSSGKQRYLCKACGRQFLEPSSLPDLSSDESETVQVANNGSSETVLPQTELLILNVPDVLESGQENQEAREQGEVGEDSPQSPPLLPLHPLPSLQGESPHIETPSAQEGKESREIREQGIAILLLDAENMKLDMNAEKFLAGLCIYPLRVKIAFANWRNHAIGKQDAELYERGYQLIHVPGGQNSADAQMIAMGVSISRHYSDAREVFVCSSDWLLTNLCNELQSQGITVYRVRRQDNSLSVENRRTGESRQYSLTVGTEIPSFEKFVEKIEELIHAEHESINKRIAQLSTVTALFQERRNLSWNNHHQNGSLVAPQNQGVLHPVAESESTVTTPEKVDIESKSSVTSIPSPSIKKINSKEEFEKVVVETIASLKTNSPLKKVSVTQLSAALQIICGETANSVVKKLKLGGNFTKFLQSCATFKVENTGNSAEVMLSTDSVAEIKSPKDLEQWMVNILRMFMVKSQQKYVPLEVLGSEFHKQYGHPISVSIKNLNLDDSFLKFVQSCSVLKLEKKGVGYQVSLTQF